MSIDIKKRLAAFAPTYIGVAESAIAPPLRRVTAKLVKVAQIIDRLFLTQVSKENLEIKNKLIESGDADMLAYFDIMYGPWDRLDGNRPFFGSKPKPPGATFYPETLTEEGFKKWLAQHPEDRARFESYFTVIEHHQGILTARPYNEAYRAHLAPAANALRIAAAHSDDRRLVTYLNARADAFASNDYRESDMAWMDLKESPFEVIIGPYEVYEDELLGLKAAFEAIIAIRNPEDSARLQTIRDYLPMMEQALPIPQELKNAHRKDTSPISVVDVLYTAGDTRAGVQAMALNLPNDEVVREKTGSKKVLFKNVAHAKFNQVLLPIAERLITKRQLSKVTFEAFFNHTLLHETAHGLGPGRITVRGENGGEVETTVNQALQKYFTIIEEAKADVLGMYLNALLIEEGFHPPGFEEEVFATFIAGVFRSVRFGAREAHGQANIIQFNYLLDNGAIAADSEGRYGCEKARMQESVAALARELLTIEARGDIATAAEFISRYGTLSSPLTAVGSKLSGIPVDICPIYDIQDQISGWFPSWMPR